MSKHSVDGSVVGDSRLTPESARSDRSTVIAAISSASFVEKVALLLITVLLSGIVVPLGISYLNAQANTRASLREAHSARAEAVLHAQTELLNEFSDTVLTFESLVLDVSWYGTSGVSDDEAQAAAFKRYDEQITSLLTRWRAQASRARLLASPEVGDRMTKFLSRVLERQDTPLSKLRKGNVSDATWDQQHALNIQISDESNELIAVLAQEMNLTRSGLP